MKNFKRIIIALFVLLAFLGCPEEIKITVETPGNEPPGGETPSNELKEFEKGITDFTVSAGNYGELLYSFSATEPAGDSYTLYYIEGDKSKDDVIAGGTSIPVTPVTLVEPGKITALKDDTTYSFIVVAKKDGYTDVESSVLKATTKKADFEGNISISWPTGLTEDKLFTTIPITANYDGDEEVTYQWNKDGTPITDENQTTFTPETAGSYTVTISLVSYASKTSSPVTVENFVPVTGITNVTKKILINDEYEISGTVEPANASFKDITWSLSSNNNNTSADITDNTLKATGYGLIKINATINNGAGWEDHFEEEHDVSVATFVKLSITMNDDDFGLTDMGEAVFDASSEVILSETNLSETIRISNAEDFEDIEWWTGNIQLETDDPEECILEYYAFSPGLYTLTIFFKAESKRWSGEITFTVE